MTVIVPPPMVARQSMRWPSATAVRRSRARGVSRYQVDELDVPSAILASVDRHGPRWAGKELTCGGRIPRLAGHDCMLRLAALDELPSWYLRATSRRSSAMLLDGRETMVPNVIVPYDDTLEAAG